MRDVRTVDPSVRLELADRVQSAKDVQLPRLRYFNYDPCVRHLASGRLEPGCQQCGVEFRKHQRVGVSWMYIRGNGLLADSVGTGKTIQAAGLIAMLKETGEVPESRVLIVCRSPAIPQHAAQLRRMLPMTHIDCAVGPRQERIERYLQPWEVMIIGYQMLINDMEMLLNFNIRTIIVDDVDALRHPDNKTSHVIKRIASECDRCIIMSGTPLQKRLPELWSVSEPLGGFQLFGSLLAFRRRYVITQPVTWYVNGKKRTGKKDIGYKNMSEFKQKFRPLALRRTAADIDDVDLPTIIPSTVLLELHTAQREKYAELREGVLRIQREEGARVKRAVAVAKFMYGQQICGGLSALGEPDGPGASAKFDWIMDKLVDGDLSDEKVVIFINFKSNLRALKARLDAANIGTVVIWGDEPDPNVRYARQQEFWEDPRVRVLLGTTAIEQSLNLQVARHLIYVDTILNPARMEQLAGRIRRDGSAFPHVYLHHLICEDTQEMGYLPLLEREQAVSDFVWDERSELFEALDPLQMLQLIGSAA